MKKKKIIIILTIIITIILLSVYTFYNTFAISSTSNENNTYTIYLNDNNIISVPSASSKTIIYQIKNNNRGKVKYAVGYISDNVIVKKYEDSIDKESDYIDQGEYRYVKLELINNSSIDSTVRLNTVLGYENGGDIITPKNTTLVTETYIPPVSLSTYITNLYANNKSTTAINNNIEYQYATSVNLMNDRLGGTTSSLDGGNIRYYGTSPKNYVYFNCEKYPSTNCELWRIIGVFDGKIKIISSKYIDKSLSWNSNNRNDWSSATLQTYLNSDYYNSLKNNITKNLIAESTWNLGAGSNDYANIAYVSERSNKKCSNCSYETTWNGKIALVYPSDYGYAAEFGVNNCNKTLKAYSDASCNNWLKSILKNYNWLLAPDYDSNNNVWITNYEDVYRRSSSKFADVFPTLYLKSDTEFKDGDGSSANPYQLST